MVPVDTSWISAQLRRYMGLRLAASLLDIMGCYQLILLQVELGFKPHVHHHYICRQVSDLLIAFVPRSEESSIPAYDICIGGLHDDLQPNILAA